VDADGRQSADRVALVGFRADLLLGVREVWFYERGSLRFFALRGRGGRQRYVAISLSEILPQLPRDLLLECMREPSQTAAVRALRAGLQGA